MMKKNYIIAGAIIGIIGILMAWIYRPYVEAHQIEDLYIGDTLECLFFIPTGACLLYGISNKYSFGKVVLIIAFSTVLYNVIGGDFGFFVIRLVAILASTVATYFIQKCISRCAVPTKVNR